MDISCRYKGCKHKCVPNLPYCQIHIADQIMTSIVGNNKTKHLPKKEDILRDLTRAERLIIVLSYYDIAPMTAKEIGATLDLSESRIRKMRRSILERIYPRLINLTDILYPFLPDIDLRIIVGVREFSDELIGYLSRHPNELYKFEPRKFERLIAHILSSLGFEVELTAPVNDGGFDIVAFNADSLGIKTKYIIECKRYRPDCPVGIRFVRSLYGIKQMNRAQHAMIATTSYFTRGSIEFMNNPSIIGLHLKDHKNIREWLEMCATREIIRDV